MEIQLIGDACVSLVFGEVISVENSRRVLAAYRQLKGSPLLGELGIPAPPLLRRSGFREDPQAWDGLVVDVD